MTSLIHIMVPNNNSDHQGVIEFLRERIVKYFGIRNATYDSHYPIVHLNCEVTEDDLVYLKNDKTAENVRFTVIVGYEDSDNVKGDFIYLG